MNDVDSDLEEGEIPDDLPSTLPVAKNKELPRRYIFKENKEIRQKHKKDCKHAIRHHAKKLAKLKKTPVKRKVVRKPYKKCPHVKSHNKFMKNSNYDNVLPRKKVNSKNNCSHFLTKKDGPLKDSSIFRPIRGVGSPQPENVHSTSDIVKKLESCSFYEMLAMYKAIQSEKSKSSEINSRETNTVAKNFEGSNSMDDYCEIIDVIKSDDCNTVASKSQELKKEESEDEEELRRIALATCAKKVVAVEQSPVRLLSNLCSNNVPELLNVGSTFVSSYYDTPVVDNFEVVDMEIDEEIENLPDTTNNLFFLDTKPSLDFQSNSNSNISKEQNDSSSDDDFEADILRAELIESMYRKKSTDEMVNDGKPRFQLNSEESFPKSDEQQENSNHLQEPFLKSHKQLFQENLNNVHDSFPKSDTQVQQKTLNDVPESFPKSDRQVFQENLNDVPESFPKSDKQVFHENVNDVPESYPMPDAQVFQENLNDLQESSPKSDRQVFQENSKSRLVRTIPGTEVNKAPERLIISLNAESSSEESDEDDPNSINVSPENPVASIEALISDIRQKSDSNDKINDSVKSVPKAVSCLSKSQQEEYNALMRILEKKRVLPAPQEELERNKIVHSPMDDLKELERKLLGVTETLKKKKELLTGLSKEVSAKKYMYMKSKLTAQHLKEQYVAAEKVRRIKLDSWSKSCKNFEALKHSVSDLETKTNHLQNLCSKVGSSIKGQNYSLPAVDAES